VRAAYGGGKVRLFMIINEVTQRVIQWCNMLACSLVVASKS